MLSARRKKERITKQFDTSSPTLDVKNRAASTFSIVDGYGDAEWIDMEKDGELSRGGES